MRDQRFVEGKVSQKKMPLLCRIATKFGENWEKTYVLPEF